MNLKNIKLSLKIIILLIFSNTIFAQIPLDVTVNVFPPYPTKYNIWLANTANYMITVVNNSDREFEYYVRASIEGVNENSGTYVRIADNFFPSVSKIIGAFEVDVLTGVDLEEMYGNAQINEVDRSPNVPLDYDGELPEGDYQLCFELMLYDPSAEVFLSPKLCSDIFSVNHGNIQLNYPLDEMVWDMVEVPIPFQWSNISSNIPTKEYEYILRIYELDPLMIDQESIYEYIKSGAVPFFIAESVKEYSYIYDVDFGLPKMIPGNLYAAQVEIVDPGQGSYFDNENLSNINTFWFGYNPFADDDSSDEPMNCFERCQLVPPANNDVKAEYDNIQDFTMGHFLIEGIEPDQNLTGSSFAGTGYITLKFLNNVKISVQFSGVTLNSERQALSGVVQGMTAPTSQNLVDDIGAALSNYVPLDEDILMLLSNACNDYNTINALLSSEQVSLPFGIGQAIENQTFTLAITRFEAGVTGANLDIVSILDLTQLGENFRLGLGASDICVAPEGCGSEFKINLIEDAFLPLDGNMDLVFKGGQVVNNAEYDIRNNQSPCYIELACEGIKAVSISGIATFSESMLVKEVAGQVVEGEQVKGYFSMLFENDFSKTNLLGEITPKSDFIIDFVMDDFQLRKLPDYSFKMREGSLDLSETRNPSEFEFPDGYENNFAEETMWQGFYLKDIEIMPPAKYNPEGDRPSATIHHILIDPTISMDVTAYNLLPYDRGSFKGWGLGIDTFELKILQNTLQRGHLDGKFGTPVFQAGAYLDFNALIDLANEGVDDYYTFNARVVPSENLQIPMAIAHASVCQNSYLTAKFSKAESEEQVEVFLKGDLDIDAGTIGETVGGGAHIRLADYQVHYNSVDGFIMPEEVGDGRGSYFGKNNNEELDCAVLDTFSTQAAFDYMMQRMIESGENVFRTIAQEVDPDLDELTGGTWRDGDDMNGLPIRFSKSSLDVIEGSPKLSLIVEAQVNPQSIVEAGIIITSEIETENNRFRFEVSDLEIYFTEGVIALDRPLHETSMASNQDLTVSWTPHFNDETLRNRLLYDIKIIPLDSLEQIPLLDSIFRVEEDFLYEKLEYSGIEYAIPLAELSPILTLGETYAIVVKATDPEGEILNNDGYTKVNVFTWGQTAIVGTNAGNNSACAERCSPNLPENTQVHGSPTSIDSFSMGNFTIIIDGPIQQSGDLISGDGIVVIDFVNNVRLDVSYSDVRINNFGQALQGQVTGKKANPTLISQVADYIADGANSQVLSILSEFLDEARMISAVMNSGKIDLPFGINMNMEGDNDEVNSLQIAFTDFNLTPTTSDVDFIYMMSLPSLGEGFNFGLGAQDICIAPEGFGSEARLYLMEDLPIPLDGSAEIVFNGGIEPSIAGNDTIQPFFLEIDCNGFKALNISGSVSFSEDFLVKEDIATREIVEGEPVRGYFGMLMEVAGGGAYSETPDEIGTGVILNYSMDPFQIKGLEGWGFELTHGVLDLSELSNSENMVFPENYDIGEDEIEMWTGFYLKELRFKPPAQYDSDGLESNVSVAIENLLIDPQLSATFTADSLLSLENGSIKGWGMSIDSFGISILQNTLLGGGMAGRMGSPVFEEDQYLFYSAVLDKKYSASTNDSLMMFTAVVRPVTDIHIPLAVADLNICASSYLGFQLGKGDENTHLELFLNGVAGLDLSRVIGEAGGDFTIGAAEFQVKYNTVKGFIMESEVGDGTGTAIGLGLASTDACSSEILIPDFDQLMADYQTSGGDQLNRTIAGEGLEDSEGEGSDDDDSGPNESAMNGFPIRLGGFDLSLNNGMPSFSFVVDIAFASGGQGFAAGAGLTFHSKKVNNGNKFNIGFDRVEFDCARLAADLDFLQLLACLCHENTTGPDGSVKKGYFGRVVVQAMDEIFIDLQGGFATYQQDATATTFGTPEFHGYWYIDGTFASNSGIPMGPVRLNALGGGIYWNMLPPPLPGHDELPDSEAGAAGEVNECINDLAQKYNITVPNGGASLTASPTHSADTYGSRTIKFMAGLSFSDPKLVIFDPLVSVTWQVDEGIDNITVGGYLYLLQDGYLSRGAPAQPPTSMAGQDDLEVSSMQSAEGSKMWVASFNSLIFDRTSGRTLVAFRGTGSLYVNVLPNILYGSASANDPYRMISHDIFIAHEDHAISRTNGYNTNGDGSTYWYAYFGNPYSPMGVGSITFDLAGAMGSDNASAPVDGSAGLTATMYAMMGHGIPRDLPPLPAEIEAIIDKGSSGTNEDNEGSFEDGDPTDGDPAREELQETTSGFAFGSTVKIEVGFEKIIYANLKVILGMDLLFQNTAGTQCFANGNTYSPPGVANFYGMGQAFAGLQGEVGVRGKILGKEIDVEFLSLSAAIMVRAGGPNPFWIDGKAAIRYSVLGGMIKGNARLEVSAGDICYPYNNRPFSLDVIDYIYPDDSYRNDKAADPDSSPRVGFKMPVADASRPWEAEINIPVVLPDGVDVKTVSPVLMNLELNKVKPNNSLENVAGNVRFSSTRRSVMYKASGELGVSDQETENKDYRLRIKIKAKERIGNSWVFINDFEIDSTVNFETAPLTPYIDKVTYTNPIRGQRYFMPEEWISGQMSLDGQASSVTKGLVKFYHNQKTQRFYAVDDFNNDCHYDVVFRKASDNEEVSRYTLLPQQIFQKKIEFPLPTSLELNTSYTMQIIRRKTRNGLPLLSKTVKTKTSEQIEKNISLQYDVEADYTIEYETDDENAYEEVNPNEQLIHLVVFRTSRFNNLQEKLANAELEFIPRGTSIYNNNHEFGLAYDNIDITNLVEPFEEIELLGYTTKIFDGGQRFDYFTLPRIAIIDPFKGNYHDNYVKPDMNMLLDKIRTKIDGHFVGLRTNIFIPYIGQVPPTDVIFNFNENLNYLNWSSYNLGLTNMYANSSVKLDDYRLSQSYFNDPIPQESSTFDLNNVMGFVQISLADGSMTPLSKDVMVGYRTREYVGLDFIDLVNWTEEKLDLILNGSSVIIQTLPYFQLALLINPVINSYNELVNNPIYTGNKPNIPPLLYFPPNNGSLTLMMNPFVFKSSSIEFHYNKDAVDKATHNISILSSKVIKTLDD